MWSSIVELLLSATLVQSKPVYFGEEQFNRVVEHMTIETAYGRLQYKKVYRNFWATSYDSTCEGCDMVTATGMKQGYGVVAVDPKVIPLYSKLYIPGYGVAVAGDVGGAVKGEKIDLGFDRLEGQWSARKVDVYLLVD